MAFAINYKVEVMIFQNLDAQAPNSQPQAFEATDYDRAVDVRSGGGRIRPVSANALDGAGSRLSSSGHYRVLSHVAWVQPGVGNRSAVPVRIESPGLLDGTVKVSLSRYLHTYTDFTYGSSGNTVRIKDHRRMRSRELHYIDNALFGILIEITPV